jgi:hypothetical protein
MKTIKNNTDTKIQTLSLSSLKKVIGGAHTTSDDAYVLADFLSRLNK